MPAIFDASGERPQWASPNEHQVTEALLAQADGLQRYGLDGGAQFVLPFWLLSDLEMIAGRTVVRADVDGPMVAIPAPTSG
jgi:hypothetical protein